jgi:hypothetical protein
MTTALFRHLLDEISMAEPFPIAAEPPQLDAMRPMGEASAQDPLSAQSMWSAPELVGEHPWFTSRLAEPGTYGAMMARPAEPYEPSADMSPQETIMRATHDQQPQHNLEAVIQESLPSGVQQAPFEMERTMQDQQMQQIEQMQNPFMMPDFEPGQ